MPRAEPLTCAKFCIAMMSAAIGTRVQRSATVSIVFTDNSIPCKTRKRGEYFAQREPRIPCNIIENIYGGALFHVVTRFPILFTLNVGTNAIIGAAQRTRRVNELPIHATLSLGAQTWTISSRQMMSRAGQDLQTVRAFVQIFLKLFSAIVDIVSTTRLKDAAKFRRQQIAGGVAVARTKLIENWKHFNHRWSNGTMDLYNGKSDVTGQGVNASIRNIYGAAIAAQIVSWRISLQEIRGNDG